MFVGEFMAIIDGIGRVKDLLLNEQEKQIVKELVIRFDESNLFDPGNHVKYALINHKGHLEKYRYYQDYLHKHAKIISKALAKAKDKQLIDKLSGLRTANKQFIQQDEEFELSDKDIHDYRGKELSRLREIIDRYRWVMCMCILSLIQTVDVEIPSVKKSNFETMTGKLSQQLITDNFYNFQKAGSR